jgi:photosystem II stability/assembly factor-like uncharacterized protein
MSHLRAFRRLPTLAGFVAAAVLTALVALPAAPRVFDASAAQVSRSCPPGYIPLTQDGSTTLAGHLHRDRLCISAKHPEDAQEVAASGAQQFAKYAAPSGKIPASSYNRAIQQRNRLLKKGQSPANRHRWTPYGKGPLQAQDAPYAGVNGLGLVELAGRITDFAYVPPTDKHFPDTVFASVAYGGVWKSTDEGKTWKSIGNTLPTQIVGSVNYTPARGGTIVAITGDGSFGRYSRPGAGAFWSRNGRKWHRAKGVPSDAFGFNVAVDQKHPERVYVATGKGLFRSRDAGRTFHNVKLPTGKCKGKSSGTCMLANEVTDVIVKAPGGAPARHGGAVLAAVGWRDGANPYSNGKPQSAFNGLYYSKNGKPGSFKMLAPSGFAPQNRIGRVEFGPAIGPDQDHNYVYATVQDAQLSSGGSYGIDADQAAGAIPSVWNGLYASSDFGQTWTKMYDAAEAQQPASGSALAAVAQTQSNYGPGIQSWYDEWVVPDPTRQAGGVPTRLLFGLEEVWMNDDTSAPQTGHSSFHVIGRYFGGSTCLFLDPTQGGSVPYACPTNRGQPVTITNTTHPDQHSALFIPHQDGSVTIVAGNDGGVYTQTVDSSTDFDNDHWGVGANKGFNTLYPYHAVIADDGTAWMGLQDNGTAKIQDTTIAGKLYKQRQIENLGGDGFFVGVDPRNSDQAYGEYTYGAMSGTTDGGKTWAAMNPPGMSGTTAQFSNPFAIDPRDANHVMIAGNQVDETGSGPGTGAEDWAVPYHLGTMKHPGTNTQPTAGDPANIDSAIDMVGVNAYVGFCGSCDPLDRAVFGSAPFHSGIATNVGGSAKPERYQPKGWHIAKAIGLPNRYITSIAIDPSNPKTVYVAVGGYRRLWTPPGQIDKNPRIGKGHLFVSHDAAKHFTDISANLPNYPTNWVTLRGKQPVVGSDLGVFIAKRAGRPFQVLGKGLPVGQVATVEVNPCDSNQLVAAVFGRGVYTYRFGGVHHCKPLPQPPPPPAFLGQNVAGPFGFETDTQGWTAKTTNTAENWQLLPPGHASGQAIAVEGYTNEATATLLSPKFTLAARSHVKVTWWQRTNTEDGFDYLLLDWSSDGYVWHNAGAATGQNADYPDFTQATAEFDVPAGALYIRYRLTSDQLVSFPPYDGVAVDDVLIER